MGERAKHAEISFRGIALSGGVALGKACTQSVSPRAELAVSRISLEGKAAEHVRLLHAVQRAVKQLDGVIADVSKRVGQAESLIFKVQEAILHDPVLIGQVTEKIETEGLSAEAALVDVLNFYEARISELDDVYVRERGSDIAEVRRRVLDELGAEAAPALMTEDRKPAPLAKGCHGAG